MKHLINVLVLVLLFASFSVANIVRVPQNCSTIQAALNSCSAGDTVLVSPGTYNENITWPNTSSICLMSEYGRDTTIIRGSGYGSVITLNAITDSSTVICGFTIRNGNTGLRGGGIYCMWSSPIIKNNLIDSNISVNRGGGICCNNAANPTITGNIIRVNVAGLTTNHGGGGISCMYNSFPLIESNIISYNTAVAGAGIHCAYGSAPTIKNNVISHNNATNNGGGIGCNYNSSPLIWKNNIDSNQSSGEGGGITCWRKSNPEIRENTFLNNDGGVWGGGISTYWGSSPRIVHNIIKYNNATNGGGISCYDDSVTVIDSNCIMYNTGGITGGIDLDENGTPIINYNNIVGNSHYGVRNAYSSVIINAENNWWGHASGPYHPVTNPSGQGDTVSNYVDFTPYLSDSVLVTGIKNIHQIMPENFVLYQNYPNPFNPTTYIRFVVHNSSHIKLVIYDILGKEITTLVNQRLRAGSYEVDWDGSNYPSGVYFYKLITGEFADTKKMILIK